MMGRDGEGHERVEEAGSGVGRRDQSWDELAEAPLALDPDDPMWRV